MIFDPDKLRGQRKFVIALGSLVLSFILALVGVVSGGNWVAIVGLAVGLYGWSNSQVHQATNGDR